MDHPKLHVNFPLLFLQESLSLSWALLQELQSDMKLGMLHVKDMAVSKLLISSSHKHQM